MSSSDVMIKVSTDKGATWKDYVEAGSAPTPTPTPTPEPAPSGKKFFLALYLPYANHSSQMNAYSPYLEDSDQVRIRQSGSLTSTRFEDLWEKDELADIFSMIKGQKGADFKTAKQTIALAQEVKRRGFSFIELNIESGENFDDSEYRDLLANYRKAADAAHAAGLKFRAAPMRADTVKHCIELSKFCDWLHVQTQSRQDDGPSTFKNTLMEVVNKVKAGNPDSKCRYTCQISTQQPPMQGKSLIDTFKACTDAVMDVPELDGISVWFGGADIPTVKSYVQWFKGKY